MKIYCNGCGVYLGEIRDAKLRKNIVHLCKDCFSTYRLKMTPKTNDVPDFLKDILGV